MKIKMKNIFFCVNVCLVVTLNSGKNEIQRAQKKLFQQILTVLHLKVLKCFVIHQILFKVVKSALFAIKHFFFNANAHSYLI